MVRVWVLTEGAVEVAPEDTREAGVGAEEDEGVGEGDEEGGDGFLGDVSGAAVAGVGDAPRGIALLGCRG